jgi:hypothetical protein
MNPDNAHSRRHIKIVEYEIMREDTQREKLN